MTESKTYGRVYTPKFLVDTILDHTEYNSYENIVGKHIIDNSCGNGAFLTEIVNRYCKVFNGTIEELAEHLQTYIHGIEIDKDERDKCIVNLNKVVSLYGISSVKWDVLCADTLSVSSYNSNMDYVVGNPPYVRVHNLESSYENVKTYKFANGGMTDLYLVFFEIGFNMLKPNGQMCYITPSSWLNSVAADNLRRYIINAQNLTSLIDLEHFQAFDKITTYTLISHFKRSHNRNSFNYYTYNSKDNCCDFVECLSLQDAYIDSCFYLGRKRDLAMLSNIKTTKCPKYVSVKNGFATLADKVFIGDFDFTEGTIDILKASTGKWSKCIYPYDKKGKPLPLKDFMNNTEAYNHLLSHQDKLSKSRDIEDDKFWYLFGRTQALKDVSKVKYAINTLIKDKGSIKLECVPLGAGIYSGLYILTDIEFETIKQLVYSEDFINYVKLLKNYKSGGYYTFASKDLEQYLNYKLSEKYGQSRISNGSRELF